MFGFVGLTLHGPFFLKGFQWIDRVCGPKTTIQNVRSAVILGAVCDSHAPFAAPGRLCFELHLIICRYQIPCHHVEYTTMIHAHQAKLFRPPAHREWSFTTAGVQAFTKTLLGQATVFPVYVAAFFTYTGLLEGKRLPQAVEKVQNKFWPTYCAGSIFWPCANMVNFTLVPATQRVLYVAGVGLLWNVYLSWQNSRQPASTS